MNSGRIVLLVGFAILWAGCGKKQTPLVLIPVSGKVVFKGGGAASGGTVELEPADGSLNCASAKVQADGRFILTVMIDGKRKDGAVPGTYHASYIPPSPPDQFLDHIPVENPVTISEGPNELILELPPKNKK